MYLGEDKRIINDVMAVLTCTYCSKDKTRVVYVFICDSKECEKKAKESNNAPANHAKTTFGR